MLTISRPKRMLEQVKGVSEAKAGKLLNEGERDQTLDWYMTTDFASNEIGAHGLHYGYGDACSTQ